MASTSFTDKRIVVTGGSSGLGLALAKRLAAERARIALVARDSQRLAHARDVILAAAPDAMVVTAGIDVVEDAALPGAFTGIAEQLGGIDLLINSAGILREGYFEQCPDEMFRQVMNINYFGALNCTRAALLHLKQTRGTLVNIASIGGLAGVFGYTAYNASKFAVVGLTEALRYELRPQGVSVQLICPPEFDSAMVAAIDASRTPENRAHTLTIPKHDIEMIAQETLRGIGRGRFLTVPGPRARVAVAVMRHLPGLTRALGDARVRRVYQGPSKLVEPTSHTTSPGGP